MNLKSIINPRNIKNKMNILAALFLVILERLQKSPPFCLPLNIIINQALLIFSLACSPLHTSTKCSSLTSVWFYGQQAVGSQCRTQNMIRFPQKWSTRTETLFLPTRPWATPSIPAKVIFCHWVGWPAKIMPHMYKYTVVNVKLGKLIISLRIHLSFYYYSLTEKSCKESEYFEFEFQVVRIWCISFEFSKKNLNPNCRLTGQWLSFLHSSIQYKYLITRYCLPDCSVQ